MIIYVSYNVKAKIKFLNMKVEAEGMETGNVRIQIVVIQTLLGDNNATGVTLTNLKEEVAKVVHHRYLVVEVEVI